jgi:hypothetical protein
MVDEEPREFMDLAVVQAPAMLLSWPKALEQLPGANLETCFV